MLIGLRQTVYLFIVIMVLLNGAYLQAKDRKGTNEAIVLGIYFVPPRTPSVYADWPARFKAQSVEEALELGQDVPAVYITWPPYLLRLNWKQKLAASGHSLYDLQQLFEFNMKAAQLWEELLDCQKRRDKDAELARLAYARGENYCFGSSRYDDEWRQKLSKYHEDVLTFLRTTQIKAQEFHTDPYEDRPNHFTSRSEYNNQASVLPRLHPLFVQTMLDIYVLYYPFFRYFRYEPLDYGLVGDLSDFGTKVANLFRNWRPADHENGREHFEYFLHSLYLKKDTPPTTSYGARPQEISPVEKDRARIIHNVVFLMTHFPIWDCSMWGLWPGLTAGLGGTVEDHDFPYFGGRFFPNQVMAFKATLACGDYPENQDAGAESQMSSYIYQVNPPFESYYDNFHVKKDLVTKWRELARRYLDE